jgi:hypothetical protein
VRALQDAQRCQLAAMKHPPTTFVHDLGSRLRCRKCAKAGRRPATTLIQLASHATLEPKTEHTVRTRDYDWSAPSLQRRSAAEARKKAAGEGAVIATRA